MTSESLFKSIDEVVGSGKAVISSEGSIIIRMVQEALDNGRSVTFYIPPSQSRAVRRWYFTPRRVAEIGMHLVSAEEIARITSELKVPDMGWFWSNRVECPNGHIYGAFEFMQEGIREHGRDWLGAVLEFENASIVRVNPGNDAICPICQAPIIEGHLYWMEDPDTGRGYGCCR
jgi:hypothetical protein